MLQLYFFCLWCNHYYLVIAQWSGCHCWKLSLLLISLFDFGQLHRHVLFVWFSFNVRRGACMPAPMSWRHWTSRCWTWFSLTYSTCGSLSAFCSCNVSLGHHLPTSCRRSVVLHVCCMYIAVYTDVDCYVWPLPERCGACRKSVVLYVYCLCTAVCTEGQLSCMSIVCTVWYIQKVG